MRFKDQGVLVTGGGTASVATRHEHGWRGSISAHAEEPTSLASK